MDLLLRFAIALLSLGSAAATLLSVAVCAFYARRPPQGERAMGLIIPLFLLGAAGLAQVVATWCACGRGSLEPLAEEAALRALFATAIGIGFGGGAFAAFLDWAEHAGREGLRPLLIGAGLLAPLLGQAVLVALAHSEEPQPAWMAEANLALAILAFPGFVLAGWVGTRFQRARWRRTTARIEAEQAEARERALEHAQSPLEKTRSYLEHGATTPVWHVCMALFHERDKASRHLLVEHLAKRADLQPGLEETLRGQYASLRGGALDFLRECPGELPPVGAAVLRSLELLAEDLVQSKGERSRTLDAFYEEEIARTREAAARFPELDGGMAWKKLRQALEVIAEAEHRERALRALPV
ncbi:MAG: hypothetical protein IPN34_18250 [Planctomycetes bacterium]|nr:hypothetical protein [Planctomycetota bacterium]